MILRRDADGAVLAIAQPDHAALAGRFAEAWDDDLAPDLVLATHHHDDVWAERDAAPPVNPSTGLPFNLFEIDDEARLALWRRVQQVAEPLGREAAVWVLRHAERLHRDYDDAALKAMTAAISARIDELVGELRAEGPRFDDPELARGTSLVALWDTLSLRSCFGVTEPVQAGVLRLDPQPDGGVAVAPWPFVGARVETWVDARRLAGPVADQAELDAAWAAAERVALPVVLVQA